MEPTNPDCSTNTRLPETGDHLAAIAAALDEGQTERARTLLARVQQGADQATDDAAALAAAGDWSQLLAFIQRPAFLLDPEQGLIREANEAAAQMLGFSRAELRRMAIRDLHPFEMARFREVAASTESAGVYRTRGLTCRCRSGEFVPAEIWTIRLAAPGNPAVLAVVQDLRGAVDAELSDPVSVAEYRRLQDQLATHRHLLDHGPEMVLWVGTDGLIYYANETAAETTGFKRTVLQGMAIWELDHQADAAKFPSTVDWLRRQGRTHFETQMRRADGELFPASVTVQLARPAEDEYLVSFSRDITEEVRAREEARKYLAELAHVSRRTSMGEMASAVSHEINQPLTAITTYARTGLRLSDSDKVEPQKIRDTLARMLDCAERAHEVVLKLRDYVRDQQPRLEATDVANLLTHCATLIQPEARRHGVEVDIAPDAGLPTVWVDGLLIQQVVINLARNAVEAMSEAGTERPQVSIRAQAVADGVRIDVRDNGPGMTAEQADNLFEPFFSTKGGGMGIGLSLCRSIVESHGGQISATSSRGEGTTFSVQLPAKADGVNIAS